MPDQIARKRLKKKMLDRWENEGGSISTDPASADNGRPTSDHEGDRKQLSAPASPKKKRKPTQK